MIGNTIAHYRITEKLGAGGMGIVYKAQDLKLGRFVALKLLPHYLGADEEYRRRFIHEAKAASALNHDNICTIHELGETADGQMFIAMTCYDGETLKARIESRPAGLPVDQILSVATQIAQGLSKAHEHGIVHRDVKPANVIITREEVVKLLDFGLAQFAGHSRLTTTGTTMGTVGYMSPEQARGEGVDHRTDIWALGAVLYELISGQPPFNAVLDKAAIHAALNEEPTPIARRRPEVPPALIRVVARALEKRVEDRYQTMTELLLELNRVPRDIPALAETVLGNTVAQSAGSTPERRQVSVLSCQFVSASLGPKAVDPEDLIALLPECQAICDRIIARYEGRIINRFGDGVMVSFGYPHAHEDDPRRAVHAGLGILEALRQRNAHLEGVGGAPMVARIGIHTGLVVAGDADKPIVGDTPSLATHLQHLADPDSLVVSHDTHRLIDGYFDCRDFGIYPVKGTTESMPLHRVLYASAARSRLDVTQATSLTPVVGRAREIGLLWERWEQVVEGTGQVILLNGEAGIGKSRLVRELKEHVAANPQAWLTECQCSPYHQGSALHPLIEMLERVVLKLEPEDPARVKLLKLEGFLAEYGLPLQETAPLIATLLSIPLSDSTPPLNLSPQRQKQKTLEALLAMFLIRAAQQPLLFVLEDMHWVDPSTLELLSMLIDQAPTSHLCILLTCRPDFTPPWEMRSYVSFVTLSRLPRKDIEALVGRVTTGRALPDSVLDHIVSKSDGVPLFVEEMTKTVLEAGLLRGGGDPHESGDVPLDGALTHLAIPATLRDSLMARLDHMASAKEVAQLAAVLGREFPLEWLRAISALGNSALNEELDRLVSAEILYRRGVPPRVSYVFKHALIQDAAYESLLKSTRQHYHRQLAELLAGMPELAETQPELLAHHYTEAGLMKEAIQFWHKAGQRAVQRSAISEAIGHLTKGLELLGTLPETRERMQQELNLQIALGPALMAARGFAAAEVGQAYARAQELCGRMDETPQLFPALFGVWLFRYGRGEMLPTRELGEQLLRLAEGGQDPDLVLQAHHALWPVLVYLGELSAAREHWERGTALYDPQQHRSMAAVYGGHDAGCCCSNFAEVGLWLQGYPDQALKTGQEGLNLAQKLAHPYSLALALEFSAKLHHLRREDHLVLERAEAVVALSRDQRFALTLAWGSIHQGSVLVQQGRQEEGLARMRQSLSTLSALGTEVQRPYYLAILAEACGRVGQIQEALSLVAEALDMTQANGERWYEAETLRLKGELLRQADGSVGHGSEREAEACFQQALAVSRRQGARSLELRAAMSLGRLWEQQGKRAEARQLLAEVFDWFTEGFDTVDLKEARALLEEWR